MGAGVEVEGWWVQTGTGWSHANGWYYKYILHNYITSKQLHNKTVCEGTDYPSNLVPIEVTLLA